MFTGFSEGSKAKKLLRATQRTPHSIPNGRKNSISFKKKKAQITCDTKLIIRTVKPSLKTKSPWQ